MSQILIEGEDYDPYYKSGKYAHQHKLKVYIERRIPVWRGINTIVNIADDNHYYKLGDNMINIIPVKDIAEWIKEQALYDSKKVAPRNSHEQLGAFLIYNNQTT